MSVEGRCTSCMVGVSGDSATVSRWAAEHAQRRDLEALMVGQLRANQAVAVHLEEHVLELRIVPEVLPDDPARDLRRR